MDKIKKYQTVIIILAVIIGLLFGHFDLVAQYSSNLIVPLLMTMLFGLFLSLDLKKLRSTIAKPRNVSGNPTRQTVELTTANYFTLFLNSLGLTPSSFFTYLVKNERLEKSISSAISEMFKSLFCNRRIIRSLA